MQRLACCLQGEKSLGERATDLPALGVRETLVALHLFDYLLRSNTTFAWCFDVEAVYHNPDNLARSGGNSTRTSA